MGWPQSLGFICPSKVQRPAPGSLTVWPRCCNSAAVGHSASWVSKRVEQVYPGERAAPVARGSGRKQEGALMVSYPLSSRRRADRTRNSGPLLDSQIDGPHRGTLCGSWTGAHRGRPPAWQRRCALAIGEPCGSGERCYGRWICDLTPFRHGGGRWAPRSAFFRFPRSGERKFCPAANFSRPWGV